MFKGKRILVTGGTGFIGANLVRRLIKEGANVFVLARENSNFSRINDVLEKVRIRIVDFSDALCLRKIIQEIMPTGIFHLAASNIMSGVAAPAEELEKVNVGGTRNLIDACEDIPYDFFINTGSFSELYPPLNDYAASKLGATAYASAVGEALQKPIITFRIFTPYGPFIQKGRLIYNVLLSALKNTDITMTSSGVVRDFIFVDDIVDLFLEGAERASKYCGQRFNLGTGVKTTLGEVVAKAIEMTNSKSNVLWSALPSVSYDSDKIQANMEHTFSSFNWRPRYTFEEGLKKTAEWLKSNLYFYGETL